jgi:hypothetical protein
MNTLTRGAQMICIERMKAVKKAKQWEVLIIETKRELTHILPHENNNMEVIPHDSISSSVTLHVRSCVSNKFQLYLNTGSCMNK